MSVVQIKSQLEELSYFLERPADAGHAAAVIADLTNIVINDVSPDELNICSALLFGTGEKSLLTFLSKSTGPNFKELSKSREDALDLIVQYMKKLGRGVQDYVLAIKDCCLLICKREMNSSKVKAESLEPIMKIIQLRMKRFTAVSLGIDELVDFLMKDFAVSKSTQTVKGTILQTLGLIAEVFPDTVSPKTQQLFTMFIDTLNAQIKAKKPDYKVIAGGIRGLSSMLVPFESIVASDKVKIESIFRFAQAALFPPESVKTYDIPKAGLHMVEKHAHLFRKYLTELSEKIYRQINSYCLHINRSLRRGAFAALESFLAQVANEMAGNERSYEANLATFKFFMKEFTLGIDSRASGLLEVSVCIRGFGRFAKATKKFLGSTELRKMLQKLLVFSERFYSGGSITEMEETVSHLPNFLTAFANIFLELEALDNSYLDHIERLIGTFFLVYPQVYEYQRAPNYEAVSRMFVALYSKGSFLQILLSRIMFQGLMLTCSKPINAAPIVPSPNHTGPMQTENYFEYQDLWKHILNPDVPSDLEFSKESTADLHSIIYNEFIAAIIKMLQKLVLQYEVSKDTALQDDPLPAASGNGAKPAGSAPSTNATTVGSGQSKQSGQAVEAESPKAEVAGDVLLPSVPKDFELFLNLVEFSKLILPTNHSKLFSRWIYILARELIIKANQYPLVSGFYKLLSIALKIAEKLKYFRGAEPGAKPDVSHADADGDIVMGIDDSPSTTEQETKQICFTLISKFVKEVLVRMKQYKDELLGACLQLVLAVPKEFIDVPMLVPSLVMAFKLGLAYLPLCEIGLDALEYWLQVKRTETISELRNILPSLNEYLFISNSAGQTTTSIRKVVEYRSEHDRELQNKLQLRIVRLLGKLGGHNSALVKELDLKDAMNWDTENRVQFSLMFPGSSKPLEQFFLDPLLPRIAELAQSASDRQTKVAACEFIHATILYMVGWNAKRGDLKPYAKLYEKLFPAAIRLATDVEQITRQLFEPLVFQLIHWFTKNLTQENEDTMALLDAIVEAVGDESDGSLRDFAAKCLSEFLKWSIKQTTEKQQEKNPFNAKSLFKRLYSLANHPNPYRRLGCAMAFKQLYRVFREEDALVDQFVLEISHIILFSMRLAANDNESLGTAQLCAQVLEAMGRVIVHYKDRLLKSNSHRRGHKDLRNFVDWVFTECGRHEVPVRHAAFRLFFTIVTKLPDTPHPSKWLDVKLGAQLEGLDGVIAKFEDPDLSEPDISGFTADEAKKWCQHISTALDGYLWMLSNDMIKPAILLESERTSILRHVGYFVEKFSLLDKDGAPFNTLTPSELDSYHAAKCYLITRIVKFLHVLIERHKYGVGGVEVATSPLASSRAMIRLLFVCMMGSERIGFNTNNLSQQRKLHSLTSRLCRVLMDAMLQDKVGVLHRVLKSLLNYPEMNILSMDFRHSALNVERIRSLASGYMQLHAAGILIPNFTSVPGSAVPISAVGLAERLMNALFDFSDSYSPLEMVVAGNVLQLSFVLDPSVDSLMKFLLDETVVEPSLASIASQIIPASLDLQPAPNSSQSISIKKLTKGQTFYKNFRDQIDEFLIANFGQFVKPLVSALPKSNLVFQVVLNLLERHHLNKNLNSKSFLDKLLANVGSLASSMWFVPESSLEQKENGLELVKKMIQVNPHYMAEKSEGSLFVRETFVSYLGRLIPISFKNDVLDLLPFLMTLPDKFLEPVKTKLNDMIVFDFPMKSRDLPSDSTVYNEYIIGLNKLLTALAHSGSSMLLQIMFTILKEPDHTHILRIDQGLAEFVRGLSDDKAKKTFYICFQAFLDNDNSFGEDLRLALVRKLCLPIIQKLSTTFLIEVAEKTINNIMGIVKAAIPADNEPELVTVDRHTIASRIGALNLIEAYYKHLTPNVIRDKINVMFVGSTTTSKGIELTQAVMKSAHAAKSKGAVIYEDVPHALELEYHCTAYNTLASVIVATQSKENFFTVFCFKENPTKNEMLWENIIDLDARYKFEVETNFPLANKEVTALYSKAQLLSSSGPAKPTRKYISSQYLADSSLSQDVTNSAFFERDDGADNAQTGGSDAMDVDTPDNAQQPAPDEPPVELSVSKADQSIELDSINSNPCMMAILSLIDDMVKKFGPANAQVAIASRAEMPGWMKEMHKKFTSASTHMNIKLFMVKVIANKPEAFEAWADQWFKPITKMMIQLQLELRLEGLHYFLRDICICFLKWPNFVPSAGAEDRRVATNLIEFLFRNAIWPVRSIMIANIQIIRLMIERWRSHISPSKNVVLEYLSQDGSKQRMNKVCRVAGLQLLDALIANGFELHHPEYDQNVSKVVLVDQLLGNLAYGAKDVYKAGSEVCGRILEVLDPLDKPTFETLLKDKINVMFHKEDHLRALTCLERLARGSPMFIDQFFPKIFANLKRFRGEVKLLALRLILQRVDFIEDAFKQLQPRLNELLQHRSDDDSQLVVLELLQHLMADLDDTTIYSFLDTLLRAFTSHNDDKVRSKFYEILMTLYANTESLRKNEQVLLNLLKGLADEDTSISEKVYKFWDDANRLKDLPFERLRQLMSDFYHSDVERYWLKYANALILRLCSRTNSYETSMYAALTNTEFREIHIDSTFHYRAAAMTPLFSASQSDSYDDWSSGGYSDSMDVDHDQMRPIGGLRATQANQFTATQATGFAGNFGTDMSQSQYMATYNAVVLQLRPPSATQGPPSSPEKKSTGGGVRPEVAGGFKAPTGPVRKARQLDADDLFSEMSASQPFGGAADLTQSEIRIQKRFMKTPQGQHLPSFFFSQKALKKKKYEESLERERHRARFHQVQIFRQYRQGDLPDVSSLTVKGFIEPLIALAWRDDNLARLLLSKIVQAIAADHKNDMRSLVQDLLTTTSGTSTPFIYWLLRVSFDDPDTILPPSLIGPACLRSTNYHMGIMVLEKQILQIQNPTTRSGLAKKRKAPGEAPSDMANELTEAWAQLSKLYKALGEEDVLLGLYEKYIMKQDITKHALEAELSGDYAEAYRLYEDAAMKLDNGEYGSNKPSNQEVDLWENGRLECLVRLTKWDDLLHNTLAEIDDDPMKLWEQKYRDPYLDFFIKSSTKVKDGMHKLFQFVTQSDEQETVKERADIRREHLERFYAPELAYMWLFRQDIGRAEHQVVRTYQSFVAEWSTLPQIARAGRLMKLQILQKAFEIEELNDYNFDSSKWLGLLMKRWDERFPSVRDPVNVWEDVVEQRAFLLTRLMERFQSFWRDREYVNGPDGTKLSKPDFDVLKRMLIDQRTHNYREMAVAQRKQNNFAVADIYLKHVAKSRKKEFDWSSFKEVIKLHCIRARKSRQDEGAIEKFVKALKFVDSKRAADEVTQNVDVGRKFTTLLGDVYRDLYELSREFPDVTLAKLNEAGMLVEGLAKATRDNISKLLLQQTYTKYKGSVEMVSAVNSVSAAKVHFKFARYCDSLAENGASTSIIHLFEKVIINTTESIRKGGVEARERFPRLLEIIGKPGAAELGPKFADYIDRLEPWMLLKWTSQMIAILNRPEGQYLIPVLERIAEMYPQAIIYQFTISSEAFDHATMQKLAKLKKLLAHDLSEKFVDSLHKMTNPEHRWKDWLERLKPAVRAKKWDEAKRVFSLICADLFDPSNPGYGSYNKKFATQFAKHIESYFGKEGAKLPTLEPRKFEDSVNDLSRQMDAAMMQYMKSSASSKLTEYSTWLSRFDESEHSARGVYLELPGQYTGKCKPQPEYHIRISSFEDKLLVMQSIRKPKRLKIRGNDEREHPYLVKGGEDLRLDQRVQQLFSVMNEIFASNTATSKRKMNIHTYEVVPMNTRVGMIEWVTNTETIKGIIERSLKAKGIDGIKKFSEAFQGWYVADFQKYMSPYIAKGRQLKDVRGSECYPAMFDKGQRTTVMTKFKEIQDAVPWDSLRDGIMTLSQDPEAFIGIRQMAAMSLAVFSIGSYIIGIGDRHLDNFLLNLTNGEIVGIDFGHAFGSATLMLPVPELVPFRLTAQMVNIFRPLDAEGLLKHSMVHALTALRESKDVLLNVMAVFVQEPLLDWATYARRLADQQKSLAGGDGDALWFPKKRIEIATQKLNGWNPAFITEKELRESTQSTKPYLNNIIRVVRGDAKENARAQAKDKCVSVKEQVDCLVDQATDPAILGRAWVGWGPFL